MATATATATLPPQFHNARHSPLVSSPLAGSSNQSQAGSLRSKQSRAASFPPSRPLRPFASIASSLKPSPRSLSGEKTSKPVKIIEPPENFKSGFFVLNLTQEEFSRRD